MNPKPLDDYINFFKKLTGEIQSEVLGSDDLKKIAKRCEDFSGRWTASCRRN